MNDLRTAAQQALEALEDMLGWQSLAPQTIQESAKGRAAALRAALAEPVQEPVWIQPDHLQKARQAPFLCRVEPTRRFADFVPLYTAPPQRKPLTEEEIKQLLFESAGMTVTFSAVDLSLARAIERAHEIT